MDKSSKGFLEKLVKTPSPSGFEQPIQKLWRERVQRYVDETRTDVHGNVIASLNPKGKPRVMIAGHCDEIGLMVNFVSEEGYLSVLAIGGIDGAVLAGRLVNIHTAVNPYTSPSRRSARRSPRSTRSGSTSGRRTRRRRRNWSRSATRSPLRRPSPT